MTTFPFVGGPGTTAIMSPAWDNHTALPFTTQTSSFNLTVPMCGLLVPYTSASAGTVTITQGLTPVIGAQVLLGQASTGALTVAGASGVTVKGALVTPGLDSVLRAVQTAKDVWDVVVYSWQLPSLQGNHNGQTFIPAYQSITLLNTGTTSVLVSTDPNMVWGSADGVLLAAPTSSSSGQSASADYHNAPALLWYACCQTGTFSLAVTTGASGS